MTGPQAFELLRSYVEELLDNDNMYVGRFVCGEFVRMMVKVEHASEAARIIGFLESTGSPDAANLRSLVAGDARRIEGGGDDTTRTSNGASGGASTTVRR